MLLISFLLILLQIKAESQDIFDLYSNRQYSSIGTYNDMKYQTGFCKMQGFNTKSRSTSCAPQMVLDRKVDFGVGLSHYQFGSPSNPSIYGLTEGALVCGMCIQIQNISNLPLFNNELTQYIPINVTSSHIAMIYDQCTDPICNDAFLDIDVYADDIFTKSNTYDIVWIAVDCPVDEFNELELLICTQDTCNEGDIKYKSVKTFKELFDPSFFSIIPRNMVRPIQEFYIKYINEYQKLEYRSGIGYVWEGNEFTTSTLELKLIDIFGNINYKNYNFDKKNKPLDDFRGGIIVN
jgi:hypothetical protein